MRDKSVSRYRTIVADPPWPFEWSGGGSLRKNGRGEVHLNTKFKEGLPYETMSIEAIAEVPVAGLADTNAHLYLWIPDCHLIAGHGETIARAWDFEPLRTIVWAKRGFGLGKFPRPAHEVMIVCRRGRLPFALADEGSVQTWKHVYMNGVRKHSGKPDGAYDLIERASPGPYAELFARRARLGWDYPIGDQALGGVAA